MIKKNKKCVHIKNENQIGLRCKITKQQRINKENRCPHTETAAPKSLFTKQCNFSTNQIFIRHNTVVEWDSILCKHMW